MEAFLNLKKMDSIFSLKKTKIKRRKRKYYKVDILMWKILTIRSVKNPEKFS
jgi:hypothetical protein